jgi:hypothetical protein
VVSICEDKTIFNILFYFDSENIFAKSTMYITFDKIHFISTFETISFCTHLRTESCFATTLYVLKVTTDNLQMKFTLKGERTLYM